MLKVTCGTPGRPDQFANADEWRPLQGQRHFPCEFHFSATVTNYPQRISKRITDNEETEAFLVDDPTSRVHVTQTEAFPTDGVVLVQGIVLAFNHDSRVEYVLLLKPSAEAPALNGQQCYEHVVGVIIASVEWRRHAVAIQSILV